MITVISEFPLQSDFFFFDFSLNQVQLYLLWEYYLFFIFSSFLFAQSSLALSISILIDVIFSLFLAIIVDQDWKAFRLTSFILFFSFFFFHRQFLHLILLMFIYKACIYIVLKQFLFCKIIKLLSWLLSILLVKIYCSLLFIISILCHNFALYFLSPQLILSPWFFPFSFLFLTFSKVSAFLLILLLSIFSKIYVSFSDPFEFILVDHA